MISRASINIAVRRWLRVRAASILQTGRLCEAGGRRPAFGIRRSASGVRYQASGMGRGAREIDPERVERLKS